MHARNCRSCSVKPGRVLNVRTCRSPVMFWLPTRRSRLYQRSCLPPLLVPGSVCSRGICTNTQHTATNTGMVSGMLTSPAPTHNCCHHPKPQPQFKRMQSSSCHPSGSPCRSLSHSTVHHNACRMLSHITVYYSLCCMLRHRTMQHNLRPQQLTVTAPRKMLLLGSSPWPPVPSVLLLVLLSGCPAPSPCLPAAAPPRCLPPLPAPWLAL
jgi:hypothetical protein